MNIISPHWRRTLSCSAALLLLTSGWAIPGNTAPATHTPEILWGVSKPGDRDEYVRTMQYLLRARSYKVNTDGIFGAQTKSVLMKFQRARGLKADGIAGGQTWKALIIPVKHGSKGDAVRALQNQLRATGYSNTVTVDGTFGKQTEQAVKNFQQTCEQKKDGIVGLQTWGALLQNEEGD
jgi:peptidoglycan hydrolase-like protein with peptidoglycan-binding domain